jgi:hypothetical protein
MLITVSLDMLVLTHLSLQILASIINLNISTIHDDTHDTAPFIVIITRLNLITNR